MNPLRVLAALALFTLLAACADPAPFEIVLENMDEETRFVRSSGGEPMIVLQERNGDEWSGVWTNIAWMCSRRCGAPGGQVVCAMLAAELSRAYALLPGESATVYRDEALVEPWKARCPIRRFETWLIKSGRLLDADTTRIREECEQEVLDARERFRAEAKAHPREIFDHIFASLSPELEEQRMQYIRRLDRKGVE